MHEPDADNPGQWLPPAIDTKTPSTARMYDYFLGGACNFAADRELAAQVIARMPELPHIARTNRYGIMRATRHYAQLGYRQWLDIGCGLPTSSAVHHTVWPFVPDARIGYVDNDAVTLAHAHEIVDDLDNAIIVPGDVRNPVTYFEAPAMLEFLDFSEPIVVILGAVFHFVTDDDDPAAIMADIRERLPRGSKLIFTHGTKGDQVEAGTDVAKLYKQATSPAVPRTRDQVAGLLAGWDIDTPPGIAWVTDICPGPGDDLTEPGTGPASHMYAATATVA